jgi:phospholipid transport system substrate-binding protein
MVKILHAFLLALLMAMPATVRADMQPDALAKQVTNEVIRIVKQDRDLQSGTSQKVYDLVQAKILPHFDFEHMTKLAVAQNWNKADPEQQARLVNEFRALLVRTYAASISSVVDYKVDFKPLRMSAGDTDVLVNTEVSKSGAPPIPIDYRMEKTAKGWKVYDVMVDNVSLVTVYRNSFSSEVRKGGIDGLIQTLSRRNQKVTAQAGK